MRAPTLALLLAVTACSHFPLHEEEGAPTPTRRPPPPTINQRPPGQPLPTTLTLDPAAMRPAPYPVFESKGVARAVQRGTRTRLGQPGPNYWQQFARYRIEAELVPGSSQINGRETVRYYNRSPDTLRTPRFFLNQNLFK